jgi:hypothetical protein
MNIAMLIAGRAARYDVCLLPILEAASEHHQIDLFMSINDDDCEYYNIMRNRLSKWLCDVKIQRFNLDQDFFNIVNPAYWTEYPDQFAFQMLNGKFVPYNLMSMYFNDNASFEMAINYEHTHEKKYDCYMKFRSDISSAYIPPDLSVSTEENEIFCAKPICFFTSFGLHKVPIAAIDWAWGNKKSMTTYCQTYDFVIKKNKAYSGRYFIHGESTLTDNLVENGIKCRYFDYSYTMEANRRMFDTLQDTRSPIPNESCKVDIKSQQALLHVDKRSQKV